MTVYTHKVCGEKVTVNHLPPTFALELFERWVRHSIEHENGIVGFDVETTEIDEVLGPFAPDAKLRLVQFGSRKYAWALDPHDEFWRRVIIDTLNNPELRFVSHTNYDPLWAGREFDVPADDRFIDTMPMACLLFPGVTAPKDLKELCAKHIDIGLREAEEKLLKHFRALAPVGFRSGKKTPKKWGFTNIPLDDALYGQYGGLDAIYVRRLLDVLAERMRKANMSKISNREQRIARQATQMRQRGLRVDPEWTANVLAEVEAEYMGADDYLRELWGFSPLSPRRAQWLAAHGAEFTKFTAGGAPQLTMPSAADPGTLPELLERYQSDSVLGPVFEQMVTLSSHKNLLQNVRTILVAAHNDGFAHPEIKTQAAHTGRMSIIKPAVQTLKKRDGRLRGCFIARDGKVLVGADYDSQEIRIAAAYSRDPALLRIVREGLNQHTETAKMIFGERFVDKTSVLNPLTGQTFYDAAKTLDFAQQYGAGPFRIGAQLGYPGTIDPESGRKRAHPEAYRLWLAWREAYAGLVEWTDKISEAAVIVNPWGRRIPRDQWGRGYASGNYAVQSTGRDVLGDAMVKLEDAGWGDTLWLPVHDELILEVDEDEADDACKILAECMHAEVNGIPLTATPQIIGKRWGAAKDD